VPFGHISQPRAVLAHHAQGRVDPTSSIIAGSLDVDGSPYDGRDRVPERSRARFQVCDLLVGELNLHTPHVQDGSDIVKTPIVLHIS
jgi:hypothetical protein